MIGGYADINIIEYQHQLTMIDHMQFKRSLINHGPLLLPKLLLILFFISSIRLFISCARYYLCYSYPVGLLAAGLSTSGGFYGCNSWNFFFNFWILSCMFSAPCSSFSLAGVKREVPSSDLTTMAINFWS